MSNILFHTATLYNFCGEDANGNAKYQTTVLDKVYMRQAAGVQVADRAPADQTILYFFDTRSSAASALGEARSWAEPEEWEEGHKTWTIHDDGRDILIPGRTFVGQPAKHPNARRIRRCARYKAGSMIMWHRKVTAE